MSAPVSRRRRSAAPVQSAEVPVWFDPYVDGLAAATPDDGRCYYGRRSRGEFEVSWEAGWVSDGAASGTFLSAVLRRSAFPYTEVARRRVRLGADPAPVPAPVPARPVVRRIWNSAGRLVEVCIPGADED